MCSATVVPGRSRRAREAFEGARRSAAKGRAAAGKQGLRAWARGERKSCSRQQRLLDERNRCMNPVWRRDRRVSTLRVCLPLRSPASSCLAACRSSGSARRSSSACRPSIVAYGRGAALRRTSRQTVPRDSIQRGERRRLTTDLPRPSRVAARLMFRARTTVANHGPEPAVGPRGRRGEPPLLLPVIHRRVAAVTRADSARPRRRAQVRERRDARLDPTGAAVAGAGGVRRRSRPAPRGGSAGSRAGRGSS
jgi:hypothetical protein